MPAVTNAIPCVSLETDPLDEVKRTSYKYLPGFNVEVVPDVNAIATSPVEAVIETENDLDVVESGCFLICALPVYPVKFEALPSDSVETKVSVKSAP